MFEILTETFIWKVFYFFGWTTATVIRAPFNRANKTNVIADSRKATEEKLLLAGAFLGMIILPAIYIFTPLFDFADYRLPLWTGILSAAAWLGGLWIFYLSHRDLGENWSPTLEVRKNHTLVTNGIYKSIRHPMYAAIWLMVIAQAGLLQNWIAGLSGFVSFLVLYFARIQKEEKMMIDRFGEEYQIYMRRTGRVFPKFLNKNV